MPFTTILYDLTDSIATITFNRPEVRNAFNDQMAEEVQAALKNAERDDNVRCIVITGTSRGLGRGLAEHFLARGDTVCGCSRAPTSLRHRRYHHFAVDVTDETAVPIVWVLTSQRPILFIWAAVRTCPATKSGGTAMGQEPRALSASRTP